MFGLRKKHDFEVMTLEITSSCPCRCKGCYYFLEKDSHRGEDMAEHTFSEIITKTPRVRNLVLSGGEPFAHPKLRRLCRDAAMHKTKPTILTSGAIMPSKEDLEALKPWIRGIVVTVKYPDKAKDSKWKGIPEQSNHALRFLNTLKEMKIKRHVHWVADRMNERHWDEMKRLARSYNADLEILRFLSFSKEFDKYQMTQEEFFRIRRYPDPLCPAGVLRYSVGLRGEVSPCIYSGHIVGNVLEESWKEIQKKLFAWRESKGGEEYKCFAEVG